MYPSPEACTECMTGRPKLAASVIAALDLVSAGGVPGNQRRRPCGKHRRRGSELQRRAADGRDGFPVQSLGKAAATGPHQRARAVRLRPAHSRPLFRARVAGQLRSGGEAKDRRAAGHAKLAVRRSGKRFELHRTGVCQARRRRSDERRLEVGAEGVRRLRGRFCECCPATAVPIRQPDVQARTNRRRQSVFSDTRGVLNVSAGDAGSLGSTFFASRFGNGVRGGYFGVRPQ